MDPLSAPADPQAACRTSALDELPVFIARLCHAFPSFPDSLGRGSPLAGKLRPGMGSVLLALLEEDDCIVKALVERLHLRNGTLTGLLHRLESAGLILRTPCPDDGRAFRVRLTARGRALGPAMRVVHRHGTAARESGLSRGEVAELKRLLTRVLQNLGIVVRQRHSRRNSQRVAGSPGRRRRRRAAAGKKKAK